MTEQKYVDARKAAGQYLDMKDQYETVRKERESLMGDGGEISITEILGESIVEPEPPRSYEEIGEAVTDMLYADRGQTMTAEERKARFAAWDELLVAVSGKHLADILTDMAKVYEEEKNAMECDVEACKALDEYRD